MFSVFTGFAKKSTTFYLAVSRTGLAVERRLSIEGTTIRHLGNLVHLKFFRKSH